jgi:hypothetical protein
MESEKTSFLRVIWFQKMPEILKTRRFALVAVIIAASLMTFLMGFALWSAPSRVAEMALLIEVSGEVEITRQDYDAEWMPVLDGVSIRPGQKVRTGPDGTVVLLFYEGSRTTLAPETEVMLSRLEGNGRRSLNMALTQIRGETSHNVVPLQGRGSSFEIYTQAGSASVKGTSFRVAVQEDGGARFSVDTGKVLVTGKNNEMVLTAGQVTTVQADENMEEAAYQFTLKGILESMDGDSWTVDGISFMLDDETLIKGEPQVGDFVLVDGHIDEESGWVADMIKMMEDKKAKSSFSGIIESMGSSWVISGLEVLVDEDTDLDEGLSIGDAVEVSFTVLEDGSWLALEIKSLVEEQDPTPTATSTATWILTPTGTVTSTLTATPTSTVPITPTATVPITATPTITATTVVTNCVGADPLPKGMELAETYGVSYDEIMGWFCSGYGFGEIDQAYALSQETGIPVEDIFAMREAGLGWGEIKGELQPSKTPKPTKELKATNTPKPTKEPNPTKEPKPSKTPKPTKTPKK